MRSRKSLAKKLTEPGSGQNHAVPAKNRLRQMTKLDPELVTRKLMRAVNWERKGVSDNIGHLRRFLQAHIGQQWDSVFSKLMRRLSGEGEVHKYQVLSNLERLVQKNPDMTGLYNSFYVDAATGVLQYREKSTHPRAIKPREEVSDGQTVYKYENGFWFRYDPTGKMYLRFDPVRGHLYTQSTTKKQLSREELDSFYGRFDNVRYDRGREI